MPGFGDDGMVQITRWTPVNKDGGAGSFARFLAFSGHLFAIAIQPSSADTTP